jgi:hypothetical protein
MEYLTTTRTAKVYVRLLESYRPSRLDPLGLRRHLKHLTSREIGVEVRDALRRVLDGRARPDDRHILDAAGNVLAAREMGFSS